MSDARLSDEAFRDVLRAAKRIIVAHGQERYDSPRRIFSEGELNIARTGLNEIEVVFKGQLVLRIHSSGARGPQDVFVPGDWIGEVHRIDQSLPGGKGQQEERR